MGKRHCRVPKYTLQMITSTSELQGKRREPERWGVSPPPTAQGQNVASHLHSTHSMLLAQQGSCLRSYTASLLIQSVPRKVSAFWNDRESGGYFTRQSPWLMQQVIQFVVVYGTPRLVVTPGVVQKQKQIPAEEDTFILGFSLFQMFEYNDQHTPKNNQGHKEGRQHEQHVTRTSDAGIIWHSLPSSCAD